MSSNVTPAATGAAPAPIKFDNHDVVDGKVKPNAIPGRVFGSTLETTEQIAPIQTKFNAKVAADKKADDAKAAEAKAAADKKAADDAEWPLWMKVVLFVPVTIPMFVFTTITGALSSIYNAICGPSKPEAEAPKEATKTDKKEVKEATAK